MVLPAYLENIFLIFDVFNLLESDHVVNCEDLQREVIPSSPLSAQTDTGKGSWNNKMIKLTKGEEMMHETSRGHTLNNDVGFPLLYLATSQKYQTIDGLWLTLHCLQINWTLQMYFDWAGSMCVSRYGGKWDQNLVPGLVLYRRSEANRLKAIFI